MFTTTIIQGTVPATVADLRAGDDAAIFSDCASLQRIIRADAHMDWGMRVTWDNGPGSRTWTRIMPRDNKVQIHR